MQQQQQQQPKETIQGSGMTLQFTCVNCPQVILRIPINVATIDNRPNYSIIIVTHEDLIGCKSCLQTYTYGFAIDVNTGKLEFKPVLLDKPSNMNKSIVLATGNTLPT